MRLNWAMTPRDFVLKNDRLAVKTANPLAGRPSRLAESVNLPGGVLADDRLPGGGDAPNRPNPHRNAPQFPLHDACSGGLRPPFQISIL